MSNKNKDNVPEATGFDSLYESLAEKAEHLTIKNPTKNTIHSGAPATGDEAITETQSGIEDADEPKLVDEIESLCMNCHKNGITRLLLTKIPFFREIILMSFSCPHCGLENSEIQSAGEIQQKGSRYELRLTSMVDFARQIVKSDSCVVKFVELDIEVPPGRGRLTNVEGLLSMILEDLELQQPTRKEQIPEVYGKIEGILAQGRKMLAGEDFPFRLSLDDPAGNSWIEPDQKDGVGNWSKVEYARTPEQNESLGLGDGTTDTEPVKEPQRNYVGGDPQLDEDIIPNEVYSFPATCPGCTRHCVTHMKMVEVPNFKQVVIMSTVCDSCGYRSNEVKTGGEIPEMGRKITLRVERPEDLSRDILKSESCSLECPEVLLSVNPGTLGGRFTTVEGLLTQIRDDLHQSIFDVGDEVGAGGDSTPSQIKENWRKFFASIDSAIRGERKFSLILKDPLASSYVQNLCSPEEDPQITIEDYERTEEEEEELGLRDMKTEGYEDDVGQAGEKQEDDSGFDLD